MSNINLWVLDFQNRPGYSSLDATIELVNWNQSQSTWDLEIRYKVPGVQATKAVIDGTCASPMTATTTTASVLSTGDLKVIFKSSGSKAASTLVNTTDSSTATFVETTSVTSGLTADINPKNLYFRITTIGQAVPEGDDANPDYHCRYTTTHDLLYGEKVG